MKRFKFLIAMILTTALLFACDVADNEQSSAQTEQADIQLEVIISLEHGDEVIAQEQLEAIEGTNLMEVLKNNFEVEEDGGFVNAINGIQAEEDEPYFWHYKINGEDAMTGAEDYIVEDGDLIEFDFRSWE